MKKIFLGLVVIILSAAKGFAGDYYVVGVEHYNKGDYLKAVKSLETAVRQNPKNVNARYYLAQTYLVQKRLAEAENQYNRIIFLAPSSDASRLSEKGLSLIRRAIEEGGKGKIASQDELDKYKDNYLDYVLSGTDEAKKWASFPVKVYIEPKKQKAICQSAFMQWQERTNKFISFIFVPTPNEAQIIVTLRDKLENSATNESYIAGLSKPYYQGENIIKSDMKILTIDPNTGNDLEDSFIYFATLHEIGHSLGMKGHSPKQEDVMYAKSSTAKAELSQRDLNTINLFYRIDKKALAQRGKGSTDVKLKQAIEYANSSPDKSVGWANLGDLYREKEMYSEAVKNYKKAIAIEPQKPELQALIGAAYKSMGDKTNAFNSFKKACDLDKSNSIYLYSFAEACLDSGQKATGQLYIDKFIQANPKAVSDERIQALMNLYK